MMAVAGGGGVEGQYYCLEEDPWHRLEAQQRELESLREQRRDKDAAICFLKTKITSLQNKAGLQVPRPLDGNCEEPSGQVDLHATLARQDRRIEDFEEQVLALQQELRQRACEHADEVQAFHEALAERDEAPRAEAEPIAPDGARRDTDEVLELRRQLQLRDEQVNSITKAYDALQQHCQVQAKSSEEELQRAAEENQRLSTSLRRAGEDVDALRRQLAQSQSEVARLADALQELYEAERQVVLPSAGRSPGSPGSSASRLGFPGVDAPSGAPIGDSCGSRASPQPPQTPQSPTSQRSGFSSLRDGGVASPEEHSVDNGQWTSPERMDPAAFDKAATRYLSAVRGGGAEACEAGGSEGDALFRPGPGDLLEGRSDSELQERRDSVLQLEEEIHKQIARHRHAFGGQTPLRERAASADERSMTAFSPSSPSEPHAELRSACQAATPPPCRGFEAVINASPALPLSASSARAPPGRAATASRAERQAKPASRSGGSLVTLSAFDQESEANQRRVRQQPIAHQRLAKQQPKRQAREKARPDEAWRAKSPPPSTSSASTAAAPPAPARAVAEPRSPLQGSSSVAAPVQAPRGLFRGPERVGARPSSHAAFTPSSPLIGGSASVPLGGRVHGEVSPIKAAVASARRATAASARAPVGSQSTLALGNAARATAPAAATRGASEEPNRVESAQGDLHQRFASLRDEMKRQRGLAASVVNLGEHGASINASAVLSDLLQQQRPSVSRLQVGARKALEKAPLGGSLRTG